MSLNWVSIRRARIRRGKMCASWAGDMSLLETISLHESVTSFVVEYWKRSFRRFPWVTVGVSLVIVGGLGVALIEDITAQRAERARRVTTTRTLNGQLAELNQAEASLRNLAAFLNEQRQQLAVAERSIAELKTEHARLQPLVLADRKAVEALFAEQESRSSRAIARERMYGVGIGVVGSLIASLVWQGISALARRRSSQPAADSSRDAE